MKADIFLKKKRIIFDFDNELEFDDFIDAMDKAGYKVRKKIKESFTNGK